MGDKKKPAPKKRTTKTKAKPASDTHEVFEEGGAWFIKKGSDKFGPYVKGSVDGYVKKLKNQGLI